MEYNVNIHQNGELIIKRAKTGTNLLRFLQDNSINISSPCRGNGSCGKCRVKVEGLEEAPSKRETMLLGGGLLEKGYRLACFNSINCDIDVYINEIQGDASIVTEGRQRFFKLEPVMTKRYIKLPAPGIHDQISDLERIQQFSEDSNIDLPLTVVRELPDILRNQDFNVTLVYFDERLICVESGDTTNKLYGIAVDIGTTTIAAYLYDLTSGERVDTYSVLNPQKKHGADVISRIEYTISSLEARGEMNRLIIDCINDIIEHFSRRKGIDRNDIYLTAFAGNTTMVHFLMDLPASNIANSPFIPATTALHASKAEELGIDINRYGYSIIYPSISGFVGADTVTAVLSSGMHEEDKVSLLLDIGTNGEIVLGNNTWMYSCSTAAGPAFEGANLRNGVGGISGAIDSVIIDDDLKYTTIGDKKPIGVCGSGIVDSIANMLSAGIIDETGRIIQDDEADGLPTQLKSRLTNIDDMRGFILVESKDSAADMDIAITQKDVREVQNAKAAIAAGIRVLLKSAGIEMQDVNKVYLAGGFGSYISIDSAVAIGLIPEELKDKIESIGNAAGSGAIEGILSSERIIETEKIRKAVKYIELSSSAEFVNEYIECMMFPEN